MYAVLYISVYSGFHIEIFLMGGIRGVRQSKGGGAMKIECAL